MKKKNVLSLKFYLLKRNICFSSSKQIMRLWLSLSGSLWGGLLGGLGGWLSGGLGGLLGWLLGSWPLGWLGGLLWCGFLCWGSGYNIKVGKLI